jgi:hypothetical protein
MAPFRQMEIPRCAGATKTRPERRREVNGIARLEHCEQVARAKVGTLVRVADLSRMVGINAMRFDFRELGKLGVLHRKAFGESP